VVPRCASATFVPQWPDRIPYANFDCIGKTVEGLLNLAVAAAQREKQRVS
jgi:hypothetical protein